MKLKDFKPGDVVQYDRGNLDYLVSVPGQKGLWVNACNLAWIKRGLKAFCEELYPFTQRDAERCKRVGSFGRGAVQDARTWYGANRDLYGK